MEFSKAANYIQKVPFYFSQLRLGVNAINLDHDHDRNFVSNVNDP